MVAKCLQNLANLIEFGGKEPYMEVINPFILKNKERMIVFLDQLSVSYFSFLVYFLVKNVKNSSKKINIDCSLSNAMRIIILHVFRKPFFIIAICSKIMEKIFSKFCNIHFIMKKIIKNDYYQIFLSGPDTLKKSNT